MIALVLVLRHSIEKHSNRVLTLISGYKDNGLIGNNVASPGSVGKGYFRIKMAEMIVENSLKKHNVLWALLKSIFTTNR